MQLDLCPKCGHILSGPATSCPHCGVIFAKLVQAEARKKQADQQPEEGLLRRLFLYAKPGEHTVVIGFKAILLMVLVAYGLKLIFTPILDFPNTSWLLHAVNLVFHEAGHVFFSPFGRFLHVLGGTLGQLIIPAVVTCTFLWQRDTFGATVGAWWLGESFLDIAPYINDARSGQLMLLGGVTGSEVEDYHDWEVLLTKLNMMQYDHTLARLSFSIGSLLMLSAMLWGSYLLWKGWQSRSSL
ncbi:MAG: zinc ribbon domain-containing protein [Trichlorobacter sp.]|uniref:zinc ribbon domain-containing protein n=1 Tax=Trichlorobacter sp. TaxID=2911007 RepID=UPI00255D1E1A|nr:zinc ribbon domain-containing protein [Trichlorobacter sp.]MDK9717366.1 zinc ribbon domain-containing protein [Trichlorobacter sp.]